MEQDFTDRTVLKIITDNNFMALLQDPKTSALLGELWMGQNSKDCDGKLSDFSLLEFMATSPIKQRLPGRNVDLNTILRNNFPEPDQLGDQCYLF